MTTQRQALEAALSALESERIMAQDGQGNYTVEATPKRILEAIEKVRAALAEPEQEPVAPIPGLAADPSNFVRWAVKSGYDMTSHPLHFLFLNEKTDAARAGWKAAIEQYSLTSPQHRDWQELSEAEFAQLRQKCVSLEDLCSWSFYQGAMLAEGALRAKNGG